MASLAERRRAMQRQQSPIYTPPGWPGRVRPPGAPDWEVTAVEFLLDCCPSDYRRYPVLRRHPVVMARFASVCVDAQVRANRDGLAELRVSLTDHVAPEVIQSAVDSWAEQGAALVRTQREVALVEEALRGKVFIKKL